MQRINKAYPHSAQSVSHLVNVYPAFSVIIDDTVSQSVGRSSQSAFLDFVHSLHLGEELSRGIIAKANATFFLCVILHYQILTGCHAACTPPPPHHQSNLRRLSLVSRLREGNFYYSWQKVVVVVVVIAVIKPCQILSTCSKIFWNTHIFTLEEMRKKPISSRPTDVCCKRLTTFWMQRRWHLIGCANWARWKEERQTIFFYSILVICGTPVQYVCLSHLTAKFIYFSAFFILLD